MQNILRHVTRITGNHCFRALLDVVLGHEAIVFHAIASIYDRIQGRHQESDGRAVRFAAVHPKDVVTSNDCGVIRLIIYKLSCLEAALVVQTTHFRKDAMPHFTVQEVVDDANPELVQVVNHSMTQLAPFGLEFSPRLIHTQRKLK